jgi:gamma-glutamyl hydrolase
MIAIIEMPSYVHPHTRRTPTKYIQWVESAGITPVCIPYDVNKKELLKCLDKVQGVLWTGGNIENSTYTKEQRNTYINTLYTTYEVAKKYNDNGRHYPIWGMCQGFELLVLFQHGKFYRKGLTKHEQEGKYPIHFFQSTKMTDWFSKKMIDKMKTTKCIIQHHMLGFDIEDYPYLNIVSTQDDFINIIEYKRYPFYGVQFHLETPFNSFSKQVSVEFALFLKKELNYYNYINFIKSSL